MAFIPNRVLFEYHNSVILVLKKIIIFKSFSQKVLYGVLKLNKLIDTFTINVGQIEYMRKVDRLYGFIGRTN
jgi:hypothetical protein